MNNISARDKGLITAAVLIALKSFFFYGLHLPVFGQDDYIIYSIAIAGIIWSLLSFRQIDSGDKKFKDYFSTGFKTFVIIALLMTVFTFVFLKFNTAYRDEGIRYNSELLMKEGNHTPAEIEDQAAHLKTIFMPVMLSITAAKYLLLGALVSAVGAGFLSSKR